MIHIKTNLCDGHIPAVHTKIEDEKRHPCINTPSYLVKRELTDITEPVLAGLGLKYKYSISDIHDNIDPPFHVNNANDGRGLNGQRQCFSLDDQEIVKKYLDETLKRKDKINIVEIGVNRYDFKTTDDKFETTSTSIFLRNKRDADIYLGIDIDDKSFLNDRNKNIYTIATPSQEIEKVYRYMDSIGFGKIDILMIDGFHSINQVYKEWEYTARLTDTGIVIFHDTNAHPGPYFLLESIDYDKYDVYKYFNDIVDYGVGVLVKK